MTEIHVLFHVPKGLESIAATDIAACLPDLEQPRYCYELKTGHVHLFCRVTSVSAIKHSISAARLLSIYSVTLIASQSIVSSELLSTQEPLFEFIQQQTINTPWYDMIEQDPTSNCFSFRATFKKEGVKHKISSQEFAGHVGVAFSEFYPGWKVKMTEYDYEIMAYWLPGLPGQQNQEGYVFLLGLTIPVQDQAQRHRIFTGRTSLNPCIAYCLVLLADPRPGQVILDMCCGTATIPIEGAARFKNVFWLGSEVKMETLETLALGNVKHCGLRNIDLMLGDGRKLCYRKESVDTIVSDWPWGIRENTYKQIQGLYPKFMKQMWQVLRPEGKAYIVTQGHKLMKRVLEYDWCQKLWHLEQVKPIGIGGLDVNLYILKKSK